MTVRQEAYDMIDKLPDDDSVRFFIEMMRQFNIVAKKTKQRTGAQEILTEKREAFLHMEELKKKYPFPKDYDYEQVRRVAMEDKYGCMSGNMQYQGF